MENQVAPAELETVLLTHSAVKEVAVIGVPSSKYGEAPGAIVVLQDRFTSTPDLIQELKSLVAGTHYRLSSRSNTASFALRFVVFDSIYR